MFYKRYSKGRKRRHEWEEMYALTLVLGVLLTLMWYSFTESAMPNPIKDVEQSVGVLESLMRLTDSVSTIVSNIVGSIIHAGEGLYYVVSIIMTGILIGTALFLLTSPVYAVVLTTEALVLMGLVVGSILLPNIL